MLAKRLRTVSVTLEFAECLGACEAAPCMLINDECLWGFDGRDSGGVDSAEIMCERAVVLSRRDSGDEPRRSLCDRYVMPKFEPVLLARIDKPNSTALAGYQRGRWIQGAEKALAMKPDDVTNLVKDAGLRGRGGLVSRRGPSGVFCRRTIRGRFICASMRMRASRGRSTIGS